MTKEINSIARSIIKEEIPLIDPLFKSVERLWSPSIMDDLDDGVMSS